MAHEVPRVRCHPVVAVFDACEDTAEMLETWLESQGCGAVNAHAGDLQRDVEDFIAAHDPQFIIWDVAPPYDANWEFFRWLRKNDVLGGRRVVVTTTGKKRLEALAVGDRSAIQILGKPYDLDLLADALEHVGLTLPAAGRA